MREFQAIITGVHTVDGYMHKTHLFGEFEYGVTANITAFHAVARGSIPRTRSHKRTSFLCFIIFCNEMPSYVNQ